jgi:hypothetical protein
VRASGPGRTGSVIEIGALRALALAACGARTPRLIAAGRSTQRITREPYVSLDTVKST